ncbi:MAG TPA: DUF2788 domain-containing protein [Noviherbaspirillum sp.]|uniref:DUF2788 domain-containing protein n=1 Tax=Noviherbaspirillum sp. TaxID=1926288 RepID=UPI002B481A87|nr:DUF2788 domain-containing protein [Noviherbaspirillum sp.]HJV85472.1 DUF2788 domain-containing protein [Noviherbaspirillum sp.]
MGTVFGFTEDQIAHFGTTWGIGGLILFMLFIIGEIAWRSKAGKRGTFVLFLVLSVGMFGFVAKEILQAVLKV